MCYCTEKNSNNIFRKFILTTWMSFIHFKGTFRFGFFHNLSFNLVLTYSHVFFSVPIKYRSNFQRNKKEGCRQKVSLSSAPGSHPTDWRRDHTTPAETTHLTDEPVLTFPHPWNHLPPSISGAILLTLTHDICPGWLTYARLSTLYLPFSHLAKLFFSTVE